MSDPRGSDIHGPITANKSTPRAATASRAGNGRIRQMHSLMGNAGAQKLLARTYVTTEDDATPEFTKGETIELFLRAAPDPAEVAANRREREKAAALDWMLMVDGIEAKVRAAVGDELLVPRGYGSGAFRLSDGAAKFMREFFNERFNSDIDFGDAVDFEFLPSLPARGIHTEEANTRRVISAFFPRRWVVTLNAAVWNRLPTSARRLKIFAHELTHVVQDNLPWYHDDSLDDRFDAESEQGPEKLFTVPKALREIPFQNLDPRDKRFLLEQIATLSGERVAETFGDTTYESR